MSNLPQYDEREVQDNLSGQIQWDLGEDESFSHSNMLNLSCFNITSQSMQKFEEEPCEEEDGTSFEEETNIGQDLEVYNNPLWEEIGEDFKVFFNPLWCENTNGEVGNEDNERHKAFGAKNKNIELIDECNSSSGEKDKCSHVANFISLSYFEDPFLQVQSKTLLKQLTFDPYLDYGISNSEVKLFCKTKYGMFVWYSNAFGLGVGQDSRKNLFYMGEDDSNHGGSIPLKMQI